jgi:hypothetical protein
MTHREIEEGLNENLDDLKVRDPSSYKRIERDLNILKIRSDIAVARAPAFHRMERLH